MADLIALTRSVEVRLADRPPRFAQALTLLFVAAQLWGRIDWPWWWLASPLLISMAMLTLDRLILTPLTRYLDRKAGHATQSR